MVLRVYSANTSMRSIDKNLRHVANKLIEAKRSYRLIASSEDDVRVDTLVPVNIIVNGTFHAWWPDIMSSDAENGVMTLFRYRTLEGEIAGPKEFLLAEINGVTDYWEIHPYVARQYHK